MSPSTSLIALRQNAVSQRTFSPRGGMRGWRLSAAAALAVCALAGVPLGAQTAHYGTVVTLGSGFATPTGVAVDANGNVYVADNGNSAVKEIVAVNGTIPASPTIKTLGSGFVNPFTAAVDGSGNVYVTDYGNHKVKEIEAVNGVIPASPTIRILGSGFGFLFGSAVDKSGDVFVTDYGINEVKELVAVDGVVPASPKMLVLGGGFNIPAGVAIDGSGNIFIGDQNNSAVKEIVAASGYTTTNTVATGFSTPDGVAVDNFGNVYVANDGGNTVEEIVAVNGTIPASPTVLTLATGFSQPFDVAVDGGGNVYVADRGNNAVKEIQRAGVNFGSVNVGTASSSSITLSFTFDSGGTLGSTAVLTQGVAGLDFTDAGGGSCIGGNGYSTGAVCTVNVTFKPTAPGPRYGAVELLNGSGTLLATGYVQGTGVGPQAIFANTTSGSFLPASVSALGSGFSSPVGVAVDASTNVFVADSYNNAVKEIVAAGGWATVKILGGGFSFPNGVAVDGSGNVFVADTFNDAVKEIVAAGGYATVNTLGSGFSNPYAVAVDGSGNVFVAEFATGTVKEMVAVNGSIPASPTIQTLASGLDGPDGVAVDGSGNIFVANYNNSTVKEIVAVNGSIPASPTIKTIGSGFSGPSNLSVDGSGNVFVADTDNGLVKEIVAASGYSTVHALGNGFGSPEGVAVSKSGEVVVADAINNAVKILDYTDAPSLNFANTAVGLTSSDSPQTVTVSNDGNSALVFPLPGTGFNPSIPGNFTWVPSSTCKQTTASSSSAFALAAGGSCTMAFDFQPAMAGVISGNAVLKDNNLNVAGALQEIQLSGTGLQGSQAITFTQPASPVYFGASPITLIATGGASGNPVTFSVVSGPGSVSGTNHSVLTVTGPGTIVIAANQAGNTNYTAAPQVERSIVVDSLAKLTSPAPGSVLSGPSVTFTWTAGAGATDYELYLGSTGVGAKNLYDSGLKTALSFAAAALPTNGEKIYARLITDFNGVMKTTDYTYTAAKSASMTSPAPGSVLSGPSVTFTWTAGTGATDYELYLGSTGVGAKNLYDSGLKTAKSFTATALPTNGEKIYARLITDFNGKMVTVDYTYTAAKSAAVTSPTPGSVLAGSSVKFTWTTGTGADWYQLWVGSTGVGSKNLYVSGEKKVTSVMVTNLPTNGKTIYTRLFTHLNGALVYTDHTYTAR